MREPGEITPGPLQISYYFEQSTKLACVGLVLVANASLFLGEPNLRRCGVLRELSLHYKHAATLISN
jgi:hypothetical protein